MLIFRGVSLLLVIFFVKTSNNSMGFEVTMSFRSIRWWPQGTGMGQNVIMEPWVLPITSMEPENHLFWTGTWSSKSLLLSSLCSFSTWYKIDSTLVHIIWLKRNVSITGHPFTTASKVIESCFPARQFKDQGFYPHSWQLYRNIDVGNLDFWPGDGKPYKWCLN